MDKIVISLELTAGQHARLIEMATDLGCIGARGPNSGRPSIHTLVTDLADGAILLQRRRRRPAREATLTDKIRAAVAADPDVGSADLAERLGCSLSLVSRTRRAGQLPQSPAAGQTAAG